MMKSILVVALWLACCALPCHAQMSVNTSWYQDDGIAVASSQVVKVPASKIRCFTTMKCIADDPEAAIKNLEAEKKSIADAITAAGLSANTLKFTETTIIEWKESGRDVGFFESGNEQTGLLLAQPENEYTAEAHGVFDVSIEGKNAKNPMVSVYELDRSLRKQAVFEFREIRVLFVGEVEESQIAKAKKMAFDEAHEEAKSIAAVVGKSLGKMAKVSFHVDGRWGSSGWGYTSWGDRSESTPLKHFTPGENEVFGEDPSKLSRKFEIGLRFEIE